MILQNSLTAGICIAHVGTYDVLAFSAGAYDLLAHGIYNVLALPAGFYDLLAVQLTPMWCLLRFSKMQFMGLKHFIWRLSSDSMMT